MLSSGTIAVRRTVKDIVQEFNNWTGKTVDQHEARLPQTTSTGAHVDDYESSNADTVHRPSKKEIERIAPFGSEYKKCHYISGIQNNKPITHSRSVLSIPENGLGTDPHLKSPSLMNIAFLTSDTSRDGTTHVTAWETASSGRVGDATPNQTVKSQQTTHGIIDTSEECPGNKTRCDSAFGDGDISTGRKSVPSSESEREKVMLTHFEESVQSSSSGVASDMSSMEVYRQRRTQTFVNSVQADTRSSQLARTAASAPDLCRPTGDTYVKVGACHSVHIHSVGSSAASINQSQIFGSSAASINQSQLFGSSTTSINQSQLFGSSAASINQSQLFGSSTTSINQSQLISAMAFTDNQQRKASIAADTLHILEMHTDINIHDTRRLSAAKSQLVKTGLLLIVGEDGDGTTRMAYDIMASSNRRPFLVASISDYQCCIGNEYMAIIFADDVFGKTSFDKLRYDEWLRLMDRIKSNVGKKNVQMIMVIKSNIAQHCEDFLNQHHEAVFKFSCSNNQLTVDEMKNIFRQILSVSETLKITICDSEKDENMQCSQRQSRIFIAESTIGEIARVALTSGYPKAVTRFISTRENLSKGVTYFSHPDEQLCSLIDSWRSSKSRSDKQKYLALLCAFVHGGTFDLNDLDCLQPRISRCRQQHPTKLCNILLKTVKKIKLVNFSISDISIGVYSLNGVYLKSVGQQQYRSAADCIDNAIALSCGRRFPKEIIAHCSTLFLCSHIGPERTFIDDIFIPVRISDKATCKALANRMQSEIMQGNVESMARHIAMREPWFVKFFLHHLKSKKKRIWDVLCGVDRHSQKTFVSHASDCLIFENVIGYSRTLAEWILTRKMWIRKRKTYKKAEQIEREVLEHFCKAGHAESYFNLVEKLHIPVTTDCLFSAVETGSFAIVEHLITIKPSPFEYSHLCRALQLACLKYSEKRETKRMRLVSYLAKHASIDYEVKDLESIIHLAGRTGKSCLLGIVHAFNGDMNLVNSDRLTCLHLAAINKNAGLAKFAIDNGASQIKGDRDNQLPIHKAAQFDSIMVAQELVSRDRDILTMPDSNGQHALHIAAKHNSVATTKFLINNGAKKDAVDNLQQTPLHLAAQSGYAEVLHFLVHAGANLQMKDEHGHCPLQVACISRNSKAIKRLLKEKDKMETNTSKCLQILVDNGDEKSLKVFCNGFSENCMLTYGTSLLRHAIKIQSPLVQALIDMGADVTQQLNALAPVHVVANQGDVDLFKSLFDNGADVTDDISTTKDTVLHIAASGGHGKLYNPSKITGWLRPAKDVGKPHFIWLPD